MHKAAAWLCLSFCVAHGLVWPQPESFEAHGNPLPVSPSLSVAFDAEGQNSPIARAAGDRYLALFQRLRDTDSVCDKTGACLSTLQIRVQSNDETLNVDTSYAYSMQISDSAATIWAATPYGVAYALESFTQLLDDSKTRLVHSNIRLSDAPKYQWRGLMLDAGRRFFPTDVVQNLLDTMAIAKLNVLHLHASDMCRFAVESKIYPNLTAALVGDRGGFYTQEDIKNLIAYAKQRGIRIVPEFDLPGHCRGYLPLEAAGLEFCTTDDSRSQLADTSTNYKILHDLLGEMSELFEDDVFNIGADETRAKGVCTVNATFDLERHMLDTIASDFGKTPEGWEEILFDAGAATNTTIVNAWARHSAAEITATGRRAVESASSHFYFTSAAPGGPTGWSKCWYDIGTNVPASQESLLLGGEMSMWTDTYCFEAQCGASSGATPVGAALFPPSRDSEFGKSVGGMIWPRGFVGAGAFWSYNATVDPSSADFVAAVGKINALAQQRGSLVCPNGCSCDQLTACGKPYIS